MPSRTPQAQEKKRAAVTNRYHGAFMADLASRPQVNHKGRRKLKGPERAAVLMMALGEQYGGKIFGLLDDDECAKYRWSCRRSERSKPTWSRKLLLEFVSRMSASGALLGSYEPTERLLQQYLPQERVGGIMEEIRGPAGRTMWDKLANVNEEVLANYLKNEYPQTVAVVLSKMQSRARRARAGGPAGGLRAGMRHPHAAHGAGAEGDPRQVEQTLRTEFMSNLAQTRQRDSHEMMAEIFNNFDRQTETPLHRPRWKSATAKAPSASGR